MKKGIFSNRGITLIEIIVGVVIVGIAAAMAAPRFQTAIDRAKFRKTTREVISTLREARSKSISEKQDYGVNFNPYPAIVTLFEDDGMIPGTFDASDEIVKIDTLSSGTGSYIDFIWTAEMSEPGNPAVVFSPDGSASNGEDIWILATAESAIGFTEIHILSATGRITVDPYHY